MTKKTKLLVLGDYPLIASPTLAIKYGMPAAMFLQRDGSVNLNNSYK